MNTLGPGLWQEILKTRKMRNAHSRTWILRRKLQNLKNKNSTLYDLEYDKKKKVEKQKCTLQDLEYGEKSEKHGNGETLTVKPGLWCEIVKNIQNEKCTLFDLEYGKNTEKHGK